MTKPQTLSASLLFASTLAYALFWLVNKGILMAYHPSAANEHWLLAYFLPIGFADFAIPTACIIAAFKISRHCTLLICAGFAFLLVAVLFQELTLAEMMLQRTQS